MRKKDLKSYSMQPSISGGQLNCELLHDIRNSIPTTRYSAGRVSNAILQSSRKRISVLGISLGLGMVCLTATAAVGGPYLESAHGNSVYGVNRSTLDDKYATFATGNCAHCHESHASLQGVDPLPAGGPAPHTLFANSFNSSRTQNPYIESDNFCFYCHSDDPGPQVRNHDYSTAFGGGNAVDGPQSIMAAFNQASYHNLYDIWGFLSNDPTYAGWFNKLGNPCSACHDSHLAKRNWDGAQTGFPLLSAISKPGVPGNLWGEVEVMSTNFGYEAPYAFVDSREPAGVGEQDGGNTPDYVGFCTSCHNPDTTLTSTTLNRELVKINWGTAGLNQDKHGALSRDGSSYFREPYLTASSLKSNFILSCLDCHEAHGSDNIMLLRRRINGENLEGPVASTDAMSYLCKRCHKDDLAAAAGTGAADRWEYVHHTAVGAPYAEATCTDCHASSDGSTPVACGNCHGHGMNDSWAGANQTGRATF